MTVRLFVKSAFGLTCTWYDAAPSTGDQRSTTSWIGSVLGGGDSSTGLSGHTTW